MTTGAAALCIRVQLRCEGLSTSSGRSVNSIFFKYNTDVYRIPILYNAIRGHMVKLTSCSRVLRHAVFLRRDRGELAFHGASFRSADQVATTAYLSSHTSSKRQPLYWLLVIIVSPLTSGCQQVAARR